jgi:hypothetical protein
VRSPVADLLADLGRAFDALGISWYLFGAQAAIIYGVARLTADVDVTVRPPAAPVAEWVAALGRFGFTPQIVDPGFLAETRVLPLVHGPTGLPLDIVLAGPGLEEELLARAVVRSVDGVPVRVVEIADLVILKVVAGRPKDVDDVVALLRIHGRAVDAERVRTILTMLEEALAQSDLLRTFEAALARVRSGAP